MPPSVVCCKYFVSVLLCLLGAIVFDCSCKFNVLVASDASTVDSLVRLTPTLTCDAPEEGISNTVLSRDVESLVLWVSVPKIMVVK